MQDRPTVICVLVCMYVVWVSRKKRGALLAFWLMNENFHLSLPNSSILVIFSFIFYLIIDFLSQKGQKMLNFDLFTLKNGHQMKSVWLENLWAYLWGFKANYWLLYIFYWLKFWFSNCKILIFYVKFKIFKK